LRLASWLLLHVAMAFKDQSDSAKPYANIYEFKTLLLVDDDRQLAETLQWILASENFLVDVAHNGDEAMVKISTDHYDAIVCDIMMPRMRGDDFYRQATEIRPEFKSRFIFMTGFGNDPEIRCFLAKSGVKCLGKPFPVKKLIDCVRELLAAQTPSTASPSIHLAHPSC
jgi:two-component system, OmpR family, response regulator